MRELILYTIRTVSEYAIANEEEFRQRVLDASRIKQEAEAKGLKKKLAKAKKRYEELDVLIKKLYESYAMEKISEHRFDMLSAEYEQEQAELESVIAADQRKLLINERKNVPAWNLAKRQDLAKQISTLSEDIEELRSEKAMLLRSLDCADDAAMGDVKKDIAAMEAALKMLDGQEDKYAAELESALQQYRELEIQAAEFDAEVLTDARLELRPNMERSAVSKIQTAYDTQYSPFTMAEARKNVSKMLGEDDEFCSVRDRLRNHQQEQIALRKKEKDRDR